jgi:hypothetical protein
MDTLHKDLHVFVCICHINFLDLYQTEICFKQKFCIEKLITHFTPNTLFP